MSPLYNLPSFENKLSLMSIFLNNRKTEKANGIVVIKLNNKFLSFKVKIYIIFIFLLNLK